MLTYDLLDKHCYDPKGEGEEKKKQFQFLKLI